MSKIIAQDKSISVPGETLAVGMDILPGTGAYRDGEKIVAKRLGLVTIDGRTIKLIPLSGRYIPKTGDTVICKVIDVGFNGWRLDTNSAYSAMLSMKDATSDFIARGANLTQYYDLGDHIVCKIVNVTSQKLIDVTIIEVDPNKVPRIIGKQGSMVMMVKDATRCNISVGQNGLIWIDGEPVDELLAIQTIRKIERESHMSGLTDKIKEFLENSGKK